MKKALLSVALLILFLLASWLAAPETILTTVRADCLGPNPTATIQPSYADKVLNTQSGHLLAYWKLDETSGTTATDSSGNGRNGSYSGATLSSTTFLNSDPVPGFDGINDDVNIYTSSLASVFSGAEGTALAWAQVASSGDWTDAAIRNVLFFYINSSNNVEMFKRNDNNQFSFNYAAGGTAKLVTASSFSPTSWQLYVVTWSKSLDQAKAYIAGAQRGSTQTGLGTWSGVLSSTSAHIGSNLAQYWHGYIAHVAVWDTPLNATEIASLATVEPIVPTATPWPTCTPSPTPTYTPTPTFSPSPTPTITPTYGLYQDWTLPPPETTGTPVAGQPVQFARTMSAGQSAITIVLFAILFSLIGMFAVWLRLRNRRS